MAEWFKRFADVPGIEYQAPIAVRSESLPLYNAQPRIQYWGYENQRQESRYWPSPTTGQETYQAPAASWKTEPLPGEALAYTILRQLSEKLELPGGLKDYHEAIQECCRDLNRPEVKSANPETLYELERLCWLDIKLVETYPAIIRYEYNDQVSYSPGDCYSILMFLYAHEGYLRDAVAVAERLERFGSSYGQGSIGIWREQIAALDAEEENAQ